MVLIRHLAVLMIRYSIRHEKMPQKTVSIGKYRSIVVHKAQYLMNAPRNGNNNPLNRITLRAGAKLGHFVQVVLLLYLTGANK